MDVVRFERLAIQDFAVFFEQGAPAQLFRDGAGLAKQGILIVHFQEDEIGKLLDVIAIGNAVVAQDIAVVPDALNDGGGCGCSHIFEKKYQRPVSTDLISPISKLKGPLSVNPANAKSWPAPKSIKLFITCPFVV